MDNSWSKNSSMFGYEYGRKIFNTVRLVWFGVLLLSFPFAAIFGAILGEGIAALCFIIPQVLLLILGVTIVSSHAVGNYMREITYQEGDLSKGRIAVGIAYIAMGLLGTFIFTYLSWPIKLP
jgi:hypothetical protein